MNPLFQKILGYFDNLFGWLILPCIALLFVFYQTWPLTPILDGHCLWSALLALILSLICTTWLIQASNYFRHLLGFTKGYYSTWDIGRHFQPEQKIQSRIMASLAFPVDLMHLALFSGIPVFGWNLLIMLTKRHLKEWPWEDRILRNLILGAILSVVMSTAYIMVAYSQEIVPVPRKTHGGNKYGLINNSGDWIGSADYDEIMPFPRGALLTAFRKGEKWGYLHKTGRVVLEPELENMEWWKIDDLNQLRLNRFSSIFPKSVILIPFKEGNLWGFVHTNGTWAIPARFDEVRPFSGAPWRKTYFAAVRRGSLWGYIDQAGKEMVKPQFEQAFSFNSQSPSIALVKKNGTWGYLAYPSSFTPLLENDLSQPIRAAIGAANGYVDSEGKFVLPPVYSGAKLFMNGFAMVTFQRTWPQKSDHPQEKTWANGLIDREGKVIAVQFSSYGAWAHENDELENERYFQELEIRSGRSGKQYYLFHYKDKTGVFDPRKGVLIPPVHEYENIGEVMKAEGL